MKTWRQKLLPRKQPPPPRRHPPVRLTVERLEARVVPYASPFELGGVAALGGAAGFVINGVGNTTGNVIGGGGDVNGDGLDDLLIANVGSNTLFVVFGRA